MANDQEQEIKNIWEDLRRVEPTFEEHEKELKDILKDLLKSKPNVQVDDKFIMELREKLMDRIEQLKTVPRIKRSFGSIFSGKFRYAFGGAIISLILLFGIGLALNESGILVFQPKTSQIKFEFNKVSLSDGAFGSLIGQSQDQGETALTGRGGGGVGGGGGGLKATDATSPIACDGVNCPVFPYIAPKYVYKGENISLEEQKVEVLRKRGRVDFSASLLGFLETFDFGLADLTGFNNTRVQSINLVQDKDFGYTIYINFDEGTISIDSYWPKWPHAVNRCLDERCVEENTLKLSDVPNDEEMIQMAKNFISEHKINLGSYGEPEVINDWRQQQYGLVKMDESSLYVPDVVMVRYPLLVNGKFVYEQGGSKLGVNISINIRAKKVSGIYNLSIQEYESSMYEAETDFSKILKIAEMGGIYNYILFVDGQTKEIKIGTPELAYGVIWKYDENTQFSNMLLVPSLVFPVVNNPEGVYSFNTKIVIPLAKELLEVNDNYPRPL